MLQYILTESDRFSVAELAQMAVEGGCQWISLSLPNLDDAELKQLIEPDVVEMCREAGVFLTVDNRPDLARELGLHGVRISQSWLMSHADSSPMLLREELGPEAVIGIETADPGSVSALIPADIDFVTLPAGFTPEQRREFTSAVNAMPGVKMPVVAQGALSPEQAAEAIADGCRGIAVGRTITDAPDPVIATQAILAAL